jgi:flagellin-specific chaperone FliS
MMEARLERDATKLTKIRSLMGELRESWSELAETGAAG